MPRLSFHQRETLAHWARVNHGRATEVYRFRPHIQRRSTAALKARNLIEYNPLLGTYLPTSHGERVLNECGYEANGAWRGSNQPRKYR